MSDRYAPAPLPVEPIFDRQPAETDVAWEAFVKYRDAGANRTLLNVAQDVSKDRSLIATWSSRWSWVKRSAAWDSHLDKQRQKAQEQAAATMAERHAKAAMSMQSILQQPLIALSRHLQADPKALDKMTAKELYTLLHSSSGPWKAAIDVERLARGADTDRVQHTGLSIDDFRAAAASAKTARMSADPAQAPVQEASPEVPAPPAVPDEETPVAPGTLPEASSPASVRPAIRRQRRATAPDPYGPPATA